MRVCWLVVGLAACFSPQPASGVPCDPSNPICPGDQMCLPGGGGFTCGGGTTNPTDGSGTDMPISHPDGHPDSPPGTKRWALLQSKGSSGTDVSWMPSTAGSTIIVGVETGTTAVTSVSDDANNTYVAVANSRSINNTNNSGLELWYVRAAAAGASRITATLTNGRALVAWEVTGIAASGDPVDSVATADNQGSSNTPDGAPITTTATGDFVLSIVIVQHIAGGLTTNDFTNDETTFFNGWAHLTDKDAPPGTYTAEWNQGMTGTSCASSVAFFVDR